MAATKTDEPVREEEMAVRAWVFNQLVQNGFSLRDAKRAADAGVDYHEVETLVKRGCKPDIALRIAGCPPERASRLTRTKEV